MHQVLVLAVKALAGGVLVSAFAVLSEALEPKRFAGLFSAAPAVALAGLTITILDKGAHTAGDAATGMIAGGIGMTAYAVAAARLLQRLKAPAAAAVALGAWLVVTAAVATPLLA